MFPRPLPGSSFFPPPVDWQPRMRVTCVSAREHLSLEPSLWLPYGFLLFLSFPPYFPVHPKAVLCAVIWFTLAEYSTFSLLSVASSIRSETYWYSKQLTAVTNWRVLYQVLTTVLCKTVVGVQFLKFENFKIYWHCKELRLTKTRQVCAYCPVLRRMQLTRRTLVEALKKSRQQTWEMSETPVSDTVWRFFRWSLFLRVLFVTVSSQSCAPIWPGRTLQNINVLSHAQNTTAFQPNVFLVEYVG